MRSDWVNTDKLYNCSVPLLCPQKVGALHKFCYDAEIVVREIDFEFDVNCNSKRTDHDLMCGS